MNKTYDCPLNTQENMKELLRHYEKLRASALEKSETSNKIPGFSIMLFRGMAIWIKTFLATDAVDSPPLELAIPEIKNSASSTDQDFKGLYQKSYKEAIMILTNMILFREPRSNYA